MISNATLYGIILGIIVIVIVVISIFGVQISHFKRKINDAADYPYKYNLVIVAIFKNESWAMKEWLQHYVHQGVDHFYMIDNGSTDNWRPETEGFPVTIISDDSRPKTSSYSGNLLATIFDKISEPNQIRFYNKYFLKLVKENARWVMIVDLDEFIYARKSKTIPEVLKDYDKNVSQIYVRWKVFGSNGHITQPPSIIQGFTRRAKMNPKIRGLNRIVLSGLTKSIAKTSYLYKLKHHSSDLYPLSYALSKQIYEPSSATEQSLQEANLNLNHYVIQSYDFFTKIKMTRGAPNDSINLRNLQYFKHFDFKDVEDTELANMS